MLVSSMPPKFPIPFASGAGTDYVRSIPEASQIGINSGWASLFTGFPPLNFTPVAAGGVPPFGQDMNGILRQITQWCQWQQAGAPVFYDSAFVTSIGGYPRGAILSSRIVLGSLWMSTIDNNTSDPDAFGAGWVAAPGTFQTGAMQPNIFPGDIPAGWVPMRAGYTIGSAASGASYAAADAVFLYVKTWNAFPNTRCPVTGGRGANALADFNAGKAMQIYEMSGTSIIGNDAGTGRMTGVPVVSGSANVTGSTVGENLHALVEAENGQHVHTGTTGTESAPHTHTGSGNTGGMGQNDPHDHSVTTRGGQGRSQDGGSFTDLWNGTVGTTVGSTSINHQHFVTITTGTESVLHTHNITTNPSGTGAPHNTVTRSAVVEFLQKL